MSRAPEYILGEIFFFFFFFYRICFSTFGSVVELSWAHVPCMDSGLLDDPKNSPMVNGGQGKRTREVRRETGDTITFSGVLVSVYFASARATSSDFPYRTEIFCFPLPVIGDYFLTLENITARPSIGKWRQVNSLPDELLPSSFPFTIHPSSIPTHHIIYPLSLPLSEKKR